MYFSICPLGHQLHWGCAYSLASVGSTKGKRLLRREDSHPASACPPSLAGPAPTLSTKALCCMPTPRLGSPCCLLAGPGCSISCPLAQLSFLSAGWLAGRLCKATRGHRWSSGTAGHAQEEEQLPEGWGLGPLVPETPLPFSWSSVQRVGNTRPWAKPAPHCCSCPHLCLAGGLIGSLPLFPDSPGRRLHSRPATCRKDKSKKRGGEAHNGP